MFLIKMCMCEELVLIIELKFCQIFEFIFSPGNNEAISYINYWHSESGIKFKKIFTENNYLELIYLFRHYMKILIFKKYSES